MNGAALSDAGTAAPILGICGSLRPESYTRRALDHTLAAARQAGLETRTSSSGDLQLPLCDGGEPGPEVLRLREIVRRAPALVLATPEYCGTLSAALKNLIEWLGHDCLSGKLVGVIAVAAGNSADGSMNALRQLCIVQGMWVLPASAPVPLAERVFGQPDDPFSRLVLEHLDRIGQTLPEATRRLVHGTRKESVT